MTSAALVDRIRALPRERRLALYHALPPGALAAAGERHEFWARESQALPAPHELARIELVTGGRRGGKSWWARQLFLREWLSGRTSGPRIVASTEAAVYDTLITGPSGLWTGLPYRWRAKVGHDVDRAFTKSRGHAGRFELPGLPPVACLSAEKPGSATGQGKTLTWFDDPAAAVKVCGEAKARAMFYELRVSTSEGPRPCMIVSTTAGGVAFMRRALDGNMAGVRKRNVGSARDNTMLSRSFVADVIEDMLGDGDDSDLTGEERTETPGALWKRAWIDPHRVVAAPELVRVVVAVDPADDDKAHSDETGIVVVGLGVDGRLYVLADYTARHPSHIWPAIVAWAFTRYQCDAIVDEANRAAGLVRRCLAIEAPHAPLLEVMATRGKQTRAEPLALLYRDGQVSHVATGPQLSRADMEWIEVPVFDPATGRRELVQVEVQRDRRRWTTLEDELCGWAPREGRSPNGLDALVWACWALRPPDGEGASSGDAPAATGSPSRYAREFGRRRGR